MELRIEIVGGRIAGFGDNFPGKSEKCKKAGGRWSKRDLCWTFPLTLGSCYTLRTEFGKGLLIGRELNAWARAEIARADRVSALSSATDAELFRTPQKIVDATASRTYQRAAIRYGVEAGSFLLADEQGLGKTLETIGTIIEGAERPGWHLIFTPSVAVESVWGSEIRRWLHGVDALVVPLVGTLKQREETLAGIAAPDDVHVFVVTNIESARIKPIFKAEDGKKKPVYLASNALLPSLHARVWDTVVVDECQRALIRTSGTPTQTRAGFNLLSRNSRRRIALSGTPMRGKPEQLWGTLNWLRPDAYRSYWNWAKAYFSLTSNGFSNYLLNGFLPGGDERLATDLGKIMLRRTKAEVLPELPPKSYGGALLDPLDENSPVGVWLEPLPSQKRQIAQLEQDGLLTNPGTDEGEEVLVNGTLAEYTRSKQLANTVHEIVNGELRPTLESPKYEWLLGLLDQLDGGKLVVASQFTSFLKVVARGLTDAGYKVCLLTGETAQSKRADMVKRFQETDEIQVFMLNTKAGGVALTLDAADFLVLLDETTVPDDQAQVEDRIHRASRMHNVTIYYLRTLGSLDEEIAWIAAARMDVQRYLMDGSRGVQYARKIYQEALHKSPEVC